MLFIYETLKERERTVPLAFGKDSRVPSTFHHFAIDTIRSQHQFVVPTFFHDASSFQYDNLVGIFHGPKPVCDHDRRHGVFLQQPVQGLLDSCLGFGIEARRGLVENQERRLADHRACNRCRR